MDEYFPRTIQNTNEDGFLNEPFSLRGKKVWVAGHTGLVGSALMRRLEQEECEVLSVGWDELELRDQSDVHDWMRAWEPDVVIVAAAKVGGIVANMNAPADFLYDNLMIASNIIHEAHASNVEKLLFLGSSCIYPKITEQPVVEEALMTGALEETNAAYALAKIAGLKLCEAYRRQHGRDFISVMPCNLYGPGDRFDLQNSHVIPALMMKAHLAKETGNAMEVWGTGTPRREFLFSDDAADAMIYALRHYSDSRSLNIGVREDIAISDLADMICDVVGYQGSVRYDASQPDGVIRKLMNSERIYKAGWKPKTSLKAGLTKTYRWYLDHYVDKKAA